MKTTSHGITFLVLFYCFLAVGQSYAQAQTAATFSAESSFTIETEIALPLEMAKMAIASSLIACQICVVTLTQLWL
jgi:hypothetical protein